MFGAILLRISFSCISNLKFIYSLRLSTVTRDFPLYERRIRAANSNNNNKTTFYDSQQGKELIPSSSSSSFFSLSIRFIFPFHNSFHIEIENSMWRPNKRYHFAEFNDSYCLFSTRIHQSHRKCCCSMSNIYHRLFSKLNAWRAKTHRLQSVSI